MIKVTMQFQNLAELQDFLNDHPEQRDAPVSIAPRLEQTPAGPAVVETVVTPVEVTTGDTAAVAPPAVAAVPDLPPLPGAPAGTVDSPADTDAIFADVKSTLIAISKGAAGPAGVTEFLGEYGYSRLSDIPKSQLGKLQADLAAKYPR